MVLERINFKGSIPIFDFKNFYVGIKENTGAIFIATNYLFKTSFLKPYSPKFYAKKAYQNIKLERDRFMLLDKANEFSKTRQNFIRNLAEWETPSDVDNMFVETSNIHQGASEKANSLSSRGKRMSLNNGIFKSNDDYTLN